jgi:hypothetical protein
MTHWKIVGVHSMTIVYNLISLSVIRATSRAALISAEILLATQSLKPPSYTQILGLDERIMANTQKLSELRIGIVPPESFSTSVFLQARIPHFLPCPVRVLLHRTFFARALIGDPDDLLKSEYAVSVLATIRGARETLSWLTELLKEHPDTMARMFHVWNAGYIAAVTFYAEYQYNYLTRVYRLLISHSWNGHREVLKQRMHNRKSSTQSLYSRSVLSTGVVVPSTRSYVEFITVTSTYQTV